MRKIALAFYINPNTGALSSPPAADLDEAKNGLADVPYPESKKKEMWDLFDRAEAQPGIWQFHQVHGSRPTKYPLISGICVLEFPDQTKPTAEDLQSGDPTAALRSLMAKLGVSLN